MSCRDFYEGHRKVAVKSDLYMTIEDMHDQMDFDTIEYSHTFIQLIFYSANLETFRLYVWQRQEGVAERLAFYAELANRKRR